MTSHSSSSGMHLQEFILDPSSTPDQKAECLKLLRVVIKNLSDPVKAQNEKYQKLRLENEKIQQKLVPYSHAVSYLKSIGFVEEKDGGEAVLIQKTTNIVLMQSSLVEVTNALTMVQPSQAPAVVSRSSSALSSRCSSSNSLAEEKKSDYEYIPKLSEKQKARKLLEQKQLEEKQKDKLQRKRNLEQLKQDKYVRQNDPNWKSGVSAACAKSGDGISTFRDKYGEH